MPTTPFDQAIKDDYAALEQLVGPRLLNDSRCRSRDCDAAVEWAWDKWGEALAPTSHPFLPFMGRQGCTLPPHLRPACSLAGCSAMHQVRLERFESCRRMYLLAYSADAA
jgi:hypothetical protein